MSDSSTYNVLLVEDDQALASMVADFLLPYGIIVKIEPRGDSAASRIVDENPDAVVLDIGLPGQDGLSVLREVRLWTCGCGFWPVSSGAQLWLSE